MRNGVSSSRRWCTSCGMFSTRIPRSRRWALLAGGVVAAVAVAGVGVAMAPTALAAGEPVNIWLTTTNDSGGRSVTRGLQQQQPINFAGTSPGANQTVTVNENTTYQQFEG